MSKLCSCFKSNNDDQRKHKKRTKNIDVKSNGEKIFSFNLFLTGDDESGKTTLIKKLTALYDPFTLREKVYKISDIEHYIRDSLTDILCAFNQINPPIQLEHRENLWRVTYILRTAHHTDFDYPLEFFEHVETLWADAGIQFWLKQFNEYQLPDSAQYFLDRVNKIKNPNYIPSTEDMIYSRSFTTHIVKMLFDLENEGVCFRLLEMDLSLDEQQESIECFRTNTNNAIIFVTDCSCFDLMTSENGSQTRLHKSLDLFQTIRNNKWLGTTPIILLLNKQDLLEKKINSGVQLAYYFPDFSDYIVSSVESDKIKSDEDPEVTRAKYFIRDQFLKVNPNCYPHFTCDSDITVHLILDDHRAIVHQMHLQQNQLDV